MSMLKAIFSTTSQTELLIIRNAKQTTIGSILEQIALFVTLNASTVGLDNFTFELHI